MIQVSVYYKDPFIRDGKAALEAFFCSRIFDP